MQLFVLLQQISGLMAAYLCYNALTGIGTMSVLFLKLSGPAIMSGLIVYIRLSMLICSS